MDVQDLALESLEGLCEICQTKAKLAWSLHDDECSFFEYYIVILLRFVPLSHVSLQGIWAQSVTWMALIKGCSSKSGRSEEDYSLYLLEICEQSEKKSQPDAEQEAADKQD